jgi:hypothetical protein
MIPRQAVVSADLRASTTTSKRDLDDPASPFSERHALAVVAELRH